MKFISTRKGFEATSAESVFQGLAPDGGLYVPLFTAERKKMFAMFKHISNRCFVTAFRQKYSVKIKPY